MAVVAGVKQRLRVISGNGWCVKWVVWKEEEGWPKKPFVAPLPSCASAKITCGSRGTQSGLTPQPWAFLALFIQKFHYVL